VTRRSFTSRLDDWMFRSHPVDPQSLALYRVLYAGFLLFAAMPDASWLVGLPDALFDPPPGPFRLFHGFPSAVCLQGMMLVLSLSAVALLLGYRTAWSAAVSGLALLGLIGFEYSFGKTDHNRHMLIAVPLALAASAWGGRLASSPARDRGELARRDWALTLLAYVLALFFLGSAVPKIAGGWLAPGTQMLRQISATASGGWGMALAAHGPGWLWELGDVGAVAFEAGFVLATLLFGLRGTRVYCALSVLFHLANVVLLRIDFSEQLVVYGAFVEWRKLPFAASAGAVFEGALRRVRRAPVLSIALLGGLHFALHTGSGNPLELFHGSAIWMQVTYWAVPSAAAVVYLCRVLRGLVARSGSGALARRHPLVTLSTSGEVAHDAALEQRREQGDVAIGGRLDGTRTGRSSGLALE